MASYILDTNIISAVLSKDSSVCTKLKAVLENNSIVLISPIVFYEVKRGLYHKDTKRQLGFFTQLADTFTWCDMAESTWDLGAKFWAKIRKEGNLTGDPKSLDADSLIAAQAKENKAVVVTRNVRHFENFGVTCQCW